MPLTRWGWLSIFLEIIRFSTHLLLRLLSFRNLYLIEVLYQINVYFLPPNSLFLLLLIITAFRVFFVTKCYYFINITSFFLLVLNIVLIVALAKIATIVVLLIVLDARLAVIIFTNVGLVYNVGLWFVLLTSLYKALISWICILNFLLNFLL